MKTVAKILEKFPDFEVNGRRKPATTIDRRIDSSNHPRGDLIGVGVDQRNS